ncbi:MAG: aminopeptidase [Spirochaetaceae bacterium]|jgi:predicted aminopeptidase|nr:aminopeptidase [Spirochaetaceae bacterium]
MNFIGIKQLLSALPAFAAVICIVAAGFALEACYTLKQGAAMLSLLSSAVPVESIGRDGAPENDTRFVREVNEIRRFALEELGLKKTKNYTTYIEIKRDYLALIVSASEKDRFKRYEWHYPVVGKLPYKGFFDNNGAKKEMERLKKKNLDVLVRQVDAFSTLGWFKDPLYSFMKEYSTAHLANLIIHESFHATLFLKNHAQFNEEIAEFIGTEGSRLYIAKKFGENSDEYTALERGEKDEAAFVAYIKTLIAELEEVYKRDIPSEEKLKLKAECIAASQKRFLEEYDSRFSSPRYKFFAEFAVNNAYLELFSLYHEGASRLLELYKASGGDLRQFIQAAKTLNSKSPPYEQLEHALQDLSNAD